MLRTCVGGLLVRDNKILLGRRSSTKSFSNCWDVFGGGVEAGESLQDALSRELREELGIVATGCVAHSQHQIEGIALSLFLVSQWTGTPNNLGEEHAEIKWYAIEEAVLLENLALEAYRVVFRSLLRLNH